MKKILSAALCAALLLAALPALGPPAGMITDFYVTSTPLAVLVGDKILFAASGFVGMGPYEFKYDIYKDGISYAASNDWEGNNYIRFTAPEPADYRAKITVKDNGTDNEMDRWSPVTAVSFRPAPSNLSVTSLNWESLRISWNAVAGASGYEVWRSMSESGTYEIIRMLTGTSCTNSSLSRGTRYYYKVRSYNNTPYGSFPSSPFSAKRAGVPLLWPYISAVTAVSGTSLRITWRTVSGASGYELWRSRSSSGTYRRVYAGSGTSFTNTGLTAGTPYYYKARIVKAVGLSVYAGPWSGINAAVPLAKPVIASAEGTGRDRVLLTWGAVAGATGYKVIKSSSPSGPYAAVRSVNAASLTVTGLSAGTTYYFKVQAYKRICTTNHYGPLSGYRFGRTLR